MVIWVKPGSLHERPWRTVQHDLLGAVRRVPFDEDARQNALRPGAVHDPFDFRLTRGEASGPILRVQDESAEIAETVMAQRIPDSPDPNAQKHLMRIRRRPLTR